MSKVVVVGLDGFNPDLVLQWADELPVLKKMMDHGVWGFIESTVPPITPQAWNCALSGKNPGRYGFWDFTYRSDYSYGEPNLVSSKSVRTETLYHIMPRNGRRIAVINVPVTYPPIQIPGGYCISCFLTPSIDHQFTYPEELKEEIRPIIGDYIIDASEAGVNYRCMDKDRVLQRIYDMDKQRFALIKYFYADKKCDYVFGVIMGTDRMPHLFYRYFDPVHIRYEPDPQYINALKDHYRFCDGEIGEILKLLDRDTNLIVHSDHSVQRLDGRINLNEWLLEQGYLKLRSYPRQPTPLRACDIDWANTRAWATGYTGQIYLNVKGREAQGVIDPEEYEEVLDELANKIKAITAEDGRCLKTDTFRRKDIHKGEYARFGPDLFIYFDECRWNISEMIGYGLGKVYSYDTALGADDGAHGRYGFFAAAGPQVPATGRVDGLTLLNVAPTVLTLMGIEVPPDMEGSSIVNPQSNNGSPYSGEDEAVIRERLAALGYLG